MLGAALTEDDGLVVGGWNPVAPRGVRTRNLYCKNILEARARQTVIGKIEVKVEGFAELGAWEATIKEHNNRERETSDCMQNCVRVTGTSLIVITWSGKSCGSW